MPKKNGFMLYMDSRRREFAAAGESVGGGYGDLVDLCAVGWAELGEGEKRRFNDEAKNYNQRLKMKGTVKSTDNVHKGKSMEKKPTTDDPTKLSIEDHLSIEANCRLVASMFEGRDYDWKNQPIVICCFTLYAEPSFDFTYLPAEIGLTAMTLQDGVIDNFARIIDPSPIPRGYGIEAIQGAKVLGLPEFGTVAEFEDCDPLMLIIKDFLEHYKGKLPGNNLYVFAFESDFLLISRCLEWLYAKTKSRLPIKVLSLDRYGYLASSCSKVSPYNGESVVATFTTTRTLSSHRVLGKSLIGSFQYPCQYPTSTMGVFLNVQDVSACIKDPDNYKYFEELCCVYHLKSGQEIQNCALNISNRYAFSLLEILTLSNEVEIHPGGHFPEVDNPEKEKKRRWDWLKRWGITQYEVEMEQYVPRSDDFVGNISNDRFGNGRRQRETPGQSRPRRGRDDWRANARNYPENENNPVTEAETATDMMHDLSLQRNVIRKGASHPYTGEVPQIFLGQASSSLPR